jgi:LmbE family N-acetylglucosaminyl deacetylase
MRHVFLSPHLDDAVFSAGGTIAKLAAAGETVIVATVFTRSVANPTGFALRCQTDKGLAPDVDYMAIRRAEDRAAMQILGLGASHVLHLDLPEAPHRGYESAADLFAGIKPNGSRFTEDVGKQIASLIDAGDYLYLPAGYGNHVDHLHVIHAAARRSPKRTWYWRDTPYVFRETEQSAPDMTVDVASVVGHKLDACAAYATQLDFQFGGEFEMRRELGRFIAEPFDLRPHSEANVVRAARTGS